MIQLLRYLLLGSILVWAGVILGIAVLGQDSLSLFLGGGAIAHIAMIGGALQIVQKHQK